MYGDSSREFKIDEKIAAIKQTMMQLGSSIKAGPETTRKMMDGDEAPRGLKNSYSVEDLRSGADLLTSPFNGEDSPTDPEKPQPIRLSDMLASNKQSVDLTVDKRGMEGKSPEQWELSVLLDYEKDKAIALERRLAAKERTIAELNSNQQRLATAAQGYREEASELRSALEEERERSKLEAAKWQKEVRDIEDKLDKTRGDWETLLEKHRALEGYSKTLEARREIEDTSSRLHSLEDQRISLITENATLTQRLQSQDRDMELLRKSADQYRAAAKDAENALSTREQEVMDLKREKLAILKEMDKLQTSAQPQTVTHELRLLREDNSRLAKELQRATNANSDVEKNRQIDLLLNEIRQLKSQKQHRIRSKSTGQPHTSRPCNLARSKSQCARKHFVPQLRIKKEGSEPGQTVSTRRTGGQQVLSEVMDALDVKEPTKVAEVCRSEMKDLAALRKFAGNLAVLIRDCSPPESIPKEMSFKYMWKWVKRLVEEYMRLRKSDSEEISLQLRTLLRAKSNTELVRCCTRQTADWQSMSTVMDKLKLVLGLGQKVGLEAIDEALSTMLANPSS